MTDQVLPPGIGFELDYNASLERTQAVDDDSNGTLENLDPELDCQLNCIHKVLVEYSLYVPTNAGYMATSTQFGQKNQVAQPCIHFSNRGACYEAEFPLSSIRWTRFKYMLFESTNESETGLHEIIKTVDDVFVTGYVSNDPELRKNRRFVLKDNETYTKWTNSIIKHPKAEFGVKILTPNPKERLERKKKLDLVRSMDLSSSGSTAGSTSSLRSREVNNTTEQRIQSLTSQLIKEHPVNDKYSKESQVYVNPANPKEYIHITYMMRKKWAAMIYEGVPTVTLSQPPLFDPDFQPWLVLGSNKGIIDTSTNQCNALLSGNSFGNFCYNSLPWFGHPFMHFGQGLPQSHEPPQRSPSPELPPQEGEYDFIHFLDFAGLNHLDSCERYNLRNHGLDDVNVLLSKHTTYDRLINLSLEHGVVTRLLDGAVAWKKKILQNERNARKN